MSIETWRSPGVAALGLRTLHPAPQAAVRLLCFPDADESAGDYLPAARALAPDIEVVSVQNRLAEVVCDAIGSITGPVALFGHGMGATLAFEVAYRLEAAGRTPVCLIVSGSRAPSRQRPSGPHLLDDNALLAHLRQLAGTAAGFLDDDETRRLFLPVIRSGYQALETGPQLAGARLRCPITALGGDLDPQAGLDDVRAWADHASGGFSFRAFSGGRSFLDDHRSAVLDLIRATVRR